MSEFLVLFHVAAPPVSLPLHERTIQFQRILKHFSIDTKPENIQSVLDSPDVTEKYEFQHLLGKNLSALLDTFKYDLRGIFTTFTEGKYEKDLVVFKNAFDSPFHDPNDLVNHFISHLRDCVRKWEGSTFYSPYVSLVQSSGTGKTRLIRQLSENGVYVIYACLREEVESGYPPRSLIASELLASTDVRSFQVYLLAVLRYLGEKIQNDNLTPQDLFSRCAFNTHGFWVTIRCNMVDLLADTEMTELRLSELISAECSSVGKLIENHHQKLFGKPDNQSNEKSPLRIIFAFDEAMKLVKEDTVSVEKPGEAKKSVPFYALRRALRSLQELGPAFAVFTDTSSRTSVFSPASRVDLSHRVQVEGAKLFKPFYLTQMDIRRNLIKRESAKISMKDIPTLAQLVSYGRPLWFTTFESGEAMEERSVDSTELRVMKLAIRKLLGGMKLIDLKNGRNIINVCIAILSSRLALDVEFNLDFSEQLASGYMALLGYISPNREMVIARYASEPILAEAAAHCIWYLSPSKIIEEYYKALRYLPSGETGELVGRILLVLAFDSLTGISCPTPKKSDAKAEASSSQAQELIRPPLTKGISIQELDQGVFFTKVRSVKDYIQSLIGKKNFSAQKLSKLKWMEETNICFNHFHRVHQKVTPELVEESLKASMAIVCQANEFGVDLIIPTHRGDQTLSSDKVDAIFVQVKNRHSYYSEFQVRDKLVQSYKRVFNKDPSETLLISMGVGTKDFNSDNFETSAVYMQDNVLVLRGLDKKIYEFLDRDPGLEGALKALASHNIQLPGKFEEDDVRFVKSTFQRTFD